VAWGEGEGGGGGGRGLMPCVGLVGGEGEGEWVLEWGVFLAWGNH